MDLIPKSPALAIAEQIASISSELANHVASQLKCIHDLASTAGLQQDIMDAFGANAVSALTAYSAFHQAVSVANPGHDVPAPNMAIFKPQLNGTVVYIAPPEPEPLPIP